jgi:hypothetical protein
MKKSILFLTDLSNGEREDLITAEYLRKDFDVTISYLEGIQEIEDNFDLIVVRNIWPSNHSKFNIYNEVKRNFLKRAGLKNLKVYNDLNANCDHQGKNYLVELYKNSFSVIPSIDSMDDLNLLPEVDQYFIKPKNGFSSIGIEIIPREDLLKMKLNDCIIQPKINFQYELSFYFIDKEFLYCLIFEPSKIPNWPNPKYYEPTNEEIQFAQEFINWNKMQYGVCRVDSLKTNDGGLLLLEIEDDSPYFSITEISERLQNLFLSKIMRSIKNILTK